MSKEDYKSPAGTALSWGNGEEMVHEVGSLPPIHSQHPTEMPKGQETAGQIPPGPSCCRPMPCTVQAASLVWDSLSSWAGQTARDWSSFSPSHAQ